MKRIISIALALILTLSVCFSIPAFAATEKSALPESGHLDFSKSDLKKGKFKYEFKTIDHVEYCRKVFDDGYSTAYTVGILFDTLEYAKTATEVNIVSEIDGIPVTEAGIEICRNFIETIDNDCYNAKISENTEELYKRYICYNLEPKVGSKRENQIGINVKKVTIPDSIKFIPAETFSNMKNLRYVSLPKSLETLGQGAFLNCTSLETVVFNGNKVTRIEKRTFQNCKSLKTVKLNNNQIDYIAFMAFYNCKALKRIALPSSLRVIGQSAFDNSGLESVTIPKNAFTERIRSFADNDYINSVFANCKSLKTVTFLGNKVTFCGGMFWGCDNLSVINFKNARSVELLDCYDLFSTKKNALRINARNKTLAKSIANQIEKTHCRTFVCKKIRIYVGDELQYNIQTKKNHRYENVEARRATYFRNGYTAHKSCTVCGKTIGYKEIPRLVLEKPKITVTAGKGTIKVKYNAVKNATGFQLRYVNSNGKVVNKNFKTAKSMNVTLKKLSAGEYKVYVRASRTVGYYTAYSGWRGRTVTVK